MENAAKFIAVTFLSFFLVACGEDTAGTNTQKQTEAKKSVNKVLSVTDFEYTLNDRPAVSVTVGADDHNYFGITFYRENVRAGYSVAESGHDLQEISMDGTWDKVLYVQSSKHPTRLNFSIVSITPEEAVIEVSAKLVNPSPERYFDLPKTRFSIQGEQLKHLLL